MNSDNNNSIIKSVSTNIKSFIENYWKDSVLLATFATFLCENCQKKLCSSCKLETNIFEERLLFAENKSQIKKEAENFFSYHLRKYSICYLHQKQLELYCEYHRTLLCLQCFIREHYRDSLCECVLIEEAFDTLLKKFNAMTNKKIKNTSLKEILIKILCKSVENLFNRRVDNIQGIVAQVLLDINSSQKESSYSSLSTSEISINSQMKLTDRFLTLLHALPQEELLCMFSAGFKTNFLNSLVGLLTQEEVEKQSSLKRDLKDPPTAFVDSNSLKECKSSEKHTILKLISELINFEELHFKVLYNKRIIQNFHLDLTIRKKKLIKEEVQIILDDANALKTTLENNLDLLASIYLYLNSCSAADNFLCNSEELKMGISLLLAYQRDNIEHLRRIHSFVSLLDRNKVSLNLTDSHPLPPRPPDACICSIYECANSTFPSVYPPLTSLNVPNNFEELKPVSLKVDHEPSFQQESALTKSPERRASDSCLDRKSVEDDYIKAVLKELREKFSEKVNL